LILGGSQGAHRINAAVTEALAELKEKDRYHFIHQTGTQDEAFVAECYQTNKVSAEVGAFFQDMASPLGAADLVICRAGATTVAEITALGIAAIFIPFPYAADNHQVLNARELEAEGAAEVILEPDLNGKMLAQRIADYASHPEALREMADKSKKRGKPGAARDIVDDCYDLIREN
jgi:UDP-N-acetylglucosamine--N-acetylmuramyl-(pentapeptide) pyrophosphoryl-undecaprenol N-acetylglucosamine transferase